SAQMKACLYVNLATGRLYNHDSYSLPLPLSVSLCFLFLSSATPPYTHTITHTLAHTRAHTHTHTLTRKSHSSKRQTLLKICLLSVCTHKRHCCNPQRCEALN